MFLLIEGYINLIWTGQRLKGKDIHTLDKNIKKVYTKYHYIEQRPERSSPA